jgi:hypothetical protein
MRWRRWDRLRKLGHEVGFYGVRIESPTTLFWGEGDDEVPKEDMLA